MSSLSKFLLGSRWLSLQKALAPQLAGTWHTFLFSHLATCTFWYLTPFLTLSMGGGSSEW